MKQITLLFSIMLSMVLTVKAQEEGNELTISGSVDTYFKYDFSGNENIFTSFANEQNSISIGMIDIGLAQTVGKASFVGEISFGPRGQSQSLLNAAGEYNEDYNSFHVQNLYVSYAFSDLFSLTAGYMGTFVGYEVISPAANFNYSTSYLFSFGPFQNAGLKADFAVSDRFAFMVGIFNDWNVYQDFNGISDFGAQLYFMPVDGWDLYLNFITGKPSGTEIDLTTGWQITDKLYVGLNAANFSAPDGYFANDSEGGGFAGAALYPQYSITDGFALGLRAEFFGFKEYKEGGTAITGDNVTALTLTGNIKAGPLTVIPEFRLDSWGDIEYYTNGSDELTKSASQFVLAAVYAF